MAINTNSAQCRSQRGGLRGISVPGGSKGVGGSEARRATSARAVLPRGRGAGTEWLREGATLSERRRSTNLNGTEAAVTERRPAPPVGGVGGAGWLAIPRGATPEGP